MTSTDNAFAFANFPSILGTLQQEQKSIPPLIGLYFAASWCPDCTNVTPLVASAADVQEQKLHLVYVSSDANESQLKSYVPSSFSYIPFDNENERSGLKRYFKVCASKEAASLGVERKFGIPTLIILDSSSGSVLTTGGVDDLQQEGGATVALEKWTNLLKTE